MTPLALVSGLVLGLSILASSPCAAADVTPLTADAAYQHVQNLRGSSAAAVAKSPSKEGLEEGIRLLRAALDYLDGHAVRDLASGNASLFYRAFDVRLDLAALYVKASQYDLAMTTLEQLNTRFWLSDLRTHLVDAKIFPALEQEPRMQALLRVGRIPEGLYNNQALSGSFKATLTPAERAAGVSLFWHQARSHFAFFDNVPDLDWGKTYLEFLERVEKTSSTEEYYRVLMQLAPLLRDGHTNVYPPDELSSKFYARPPLRTALIEGRVIVTRIDSAKLKALVNAGDEIVEIDGVPVRRYAELHVDPFVSSSTPQDRDVRKYSYQLLSGDADKALRLRLKDRGGEMREVTLSRKGYDDVIQPSKFDFRLLPGDIAYISIDHFESNAGVAAFERALPRILKARGLIIDVRNNGGGDSWHGVQLLQFLSKAPIPAMNSYSRGDTALRSDGASVIEWAALPSGDAPGGRAVVFAGPVTVLTGPKTFSAAEDFVAAFQRMGRGKTLGGPTGGSTGQPIEVKLPGGGSARICAKRDTYADGTTFVGKGLTPDILVTQTLADFFAGRDTVLERALADIGMAKP